MEIYRSPMEKILKQEENNTVITNPKEPGRTFLRKIAYRYAWWREKFNRLLGRNR
ncbi:MAG: hypothetical protein V2B19_00400 [Pseudomonadota bacterium]